MEWHRWFALRPVIVNNQTGKPRVAWLQYLERKWVLGLASGLGPRWVYRKSQNLGGAITDLTREAHAETGSADARSRAAGDRANGASAVKSISEYSAREISVE
jgi:hypothetical protein